MPIDMALPVYLSKEDFVFRTSCKPCLRFQDSPVVDRSEPEDGPSTTSESGRAKKQVTFADHRGLSLTKVKIFSQFDDIIDIPVSAHQTLSLSVCVAPVKDDLVLDFAQPASDYLRFRQHLEQNLVCLENCVLKEKALAGTVKVKNVAFEKSVKLRVTFDLWRSHKDVDCEYVKNTYLSAFSDTFSFHMSLPHQLQPPEHVEFAIVYQVGGAEYWDSNQGDNYRIVWSSMKGKDARSPRSDSFHFGIHFDRYGSPTCSHGLFPDWPSYAGYENSGPYY